MFIKYFLNNQEKFFFITNVPHDIKIGDDMQFRYFDATVSDIRLEKGETDYFLRVRFGNYRTRFIPGVEK